MQKIKTQQFAKFFIKDLKTKIPKYHSDKHEDIDFNLPSAD